MFRFLRISISQLLCLTAIAGSMLFAIAYDRSEPVWRNNVLRYDAPDVPRPFELIDDRTPIVVRIHSTYTYADGRELFLENHRRGWESVRREFFQRRDWLAEYEPYDFYDEYDYSKLSFRDSTELFLLAQSEGRSKCREQLSQLLAENDEVTLRGKIAYSANWVLLLPTLVLSAAVGVLAVCCPFRWKRDV